MGSTGIQERIESITNSKLVALNNALLEALNEYEDVVSGLREQVESYDAKIVELQENITQLGTTIVGLNESHEAEITELREKIDQLEIALNELLPEPS